jgi:hypothetical protein
MAAKSKSPEPSSKPTRPANKGVLYTTISDEHQNALRVLSFIRQTTMADIVREALDFYLAARGPSQKEIDTMVDLVRQSVRGK